MKDSITRYVSYITKYQPTNPGGGADGVAQDVKYRCHHLDRSNKYQMKQVPPQSLFRSSPVAYTI